MTHEKALLFGAVLLLIGVQPGAGGALPASSGKRIALRICPVTLPDPGPANTIGNQSLTTALFPHNVVIAIRPFLRQDGTVKLKWPWWRDTPGELTVSGRRLDAKATPLKVEIAAGNGLTGVQPTYLIFPTGGCWRITGRVGSSQPLSLVTLVVKAPHLRDR